MAVPSTSTTSTEPQTHSVATAAEKSAQGVSAVKQTAMTDYYSPRPSTSMAEVPAHPAEPLFKRGISKSSQEPSSIGTESSSINADLDTISPTFQDEAAKKGMYQLNFIGVEFILISNRDKFAEKLA